MGRVWITTQQDDPGTGQPIRVPYLVKVPGRVVSVSLTGQSERRRRRWGSRPWRTMGLMALTILAACFAIVWGVTPYAAVPAIVALSLLAGYSSAEG